jgi:arylsulfatase A-like enzyme
VLILAGKDMVSSTVDARMEDIVPTLLFAMGNAVPSYMDGRVLREIMHVQRDIVYEDGVLQSKSTTNASMNSAETDAIRRRLEGLGYL